MDIYEKYKEMGRVATALLDLHLKDPKKCDSTFIVENLFNKYEELELEQTEEEGE